MGSTRRPVPNSTVRVNRDGLVAVERTIGSVCLREPVVDGRRTAARWFHSGAPEDTQMRGLGYAKKRDAVAALVAAVGGE
jgi:hypothetical protein